MRLLTAVSLTLVCVPAVVSAQSPPAPLPAPAFHHVHLNSADPAVAIREYMIASAGNTEGSFAGLKGFRTQNGVLFLFNKVSKPLPVMAPDTISARNPQTAFWHFVFPVLSMRQSMDRFKAEIPNFAARLLPLYTGPDGKTVESSGYTLPGFLTVDQLNEARAKGVVPAGESNLGYSTWLGPDGAIMESVQGPAERLSIFGLFQEQPYCAVFWYRKHLNAPTPAARGGGPAPGPQSEADCSIPKSTVVSYPSTYKRGHVRVPPAMGVNFGDVFVRWYMNQEPQPLAPMRGTVVDHFALSVTNLDAWIAKLQGENVTFLEARPYKVGDSRAVLIEGPSKEAIELLEVK